MSHEVRRVVEFVLIVLLELHCKHVPALLTTIQSVSAVQMKILEEILMALDAGAVQVKHPKLASVVAHCPWLLLIMMAATPTRIRLTKRDDPYFILVSIWYKYTYHSEFKFKSKER